MGTLKRTTKTRLDERDPEWRTRIGKPEYWMTWDGNRIRIHPYVADLLAVVGFLERPADMDPVGGPFEPDHRIPEDKQQYLPWAAAAHLLTLDGPAKNLERAKALLDEFDSLVGGSNGRGPNLLPS
jgi:hypothetical protein